MGATMTTGKVNTWIWNDGHRNIHLNDDGEKGSLWMFIPRAWAETVGLRVGNNNGAYYLGCGEGSAPTQPYMDDPMIEPGPHATPNARVALDMSIAHKMSDDVERKARMDRNGFFLEALHWLIVNLGQSHSFMPKCHDDEAVPKIGSTVQTMQGMTLKIVPSGSTDDHGYRLTRPPFPSSETKYRAVWEGEWNASPCYFEPAECGTTAYQELIRWRYIK